MARPQGSRNGRGHALAKRWAQAFGSREMLAKEIIGYRTPFPEFKAIQALERTLAVSGYVLARRMFDNKSKTYAMNPLDVEAVLNEVHDSGTESV